MPSCTHTAVIDWIVEHDPLPVAVWHDPLVEAVGFDARSVYVETYWLVGLGPLSVLAARRLASWLAASPERIEVPLRTLAVSLGVGAGTGRNAPMVRTLGRLVDFGLATIENDRYAVRTTFPPLARRQVGRLPVELAACHDRELTARALAATSSRAPSG